VIIREEWPQAGPATAGDALPGRRHRFPRFSERNGFRNLYLYDLSGKRLATLTDHRFEVANIVSVDETAARSSTWRATATTLISYSFTE